MLTLQERISVLAKLGEYILQFDEAIQGVIELSYLKNKWFTHENTKRALTSIASQFLDESNLNAWVSNYEIIDTGEKKSIGLVLAGNIPAVGFHDLLSCFVAGHPSIVKFSEKDNVIIPFLIDKMKSFDARVDKYFSIVNRLKDYDAVIATGSNNTSMYFERYFGKYPHIIRKNRNGVAVLSGEETKEDLQALGSDIFDFFGLGCRNVSKLYVPDGYNFDQFLEVTHGFNQIINHTKYKNNFDYNYALLILNKEKFLSNGCLLLREDKQIASRISNLNYEYYHDIKELENQLMQEQEKLQCVCTSIDFKELKSIPLGTSQIPSINSYADDVDTMKFLTSL